ncbi:MAG: type I secretion system permease/ATPase [Hyphomonadaceae bacterium]|nr:type I secretion system permease/ATPase [Hyphomonadaceae bacterium]
MRGKLADGTKITEPLRQALVASRQILFWALGFSAAVNLLYLAPSLYMLQIYDRVLVSNGLLTLVFISIVLAFALATLFFLDTMRTRLMARASLRIDKLLSPFLLDAALAQNARGGDARKAQALREFDTLRQSLVGPAAMAILDAPWAPIYVIICFMIHPFIGLLTLLGGAALVGVAVINENALRDSLREASSLAPKIYAAQEADGASAETIRALGMRRVLVERQMQGRADLNDLQTASLFRSQIFTSLTRFIRMALQSAVLGLGAYLAIERQISPGALIAGSILAARALAPLEQIVGAWRQIGQARSALRLVNDTLAAAAPTRDHTSLPIPKGELRIERIGVRLAESDRIMLNDVSVTVAPGELLGIVGPTGAGKSTLARVAAGARIPEAGSVRLDMANFTDWDPEQLGRHVGYLPQEIGLLAGTIAENIARFTVRTEANAQSIDAAIVEAARIAGAHELILRMPQAYDTKLGLGGSGISPGQAQRIALARALFRNPPLLVLDEPNSHLDAEGETALVEALKSAKARGAAIIVVAHRAGVLSIADRLLVLRDGRVEMQGSREEVTRRLAAAQENASVKPIRPREAQT